MRTENRKKKKDLKGTFPIMHEFSRFAFVHIRANDVLWVDFGEIRTNVATKQGICLLEIAPLHLELSVGEHFDLVVLWIQVSTSSSHSLQSSSMIFVPLCVTDGPRW